MNKPFPSLDDAVSRVAAQADVWAKTPVAERIAILEQIKDDILKVSEDWAVHAGRMKQIPDDSPLVGEEWISGPYPLMAMCNLLIEVLQGAETGDHLRHMKLRTLENGQLAARVAPANIWETLLLSGVTAEVWMEPGVTKDNLREHSAAAYRIPLHERTGKTALILGAGNIAAIAPLDCFQKLFAENQVAILKLNPVNEYLKPYLEASLQALISRNVLHICTGGIDIGQYLCNHPKIQEIHITGASSSHDAIVWGPGEEGQKNKAAGTPKNPRHITSELGGVCPTIVVPGPWNKADINFQAEQIATQKLHNSGFNCVACQMLIVPETWDKTPAFLDAVRSTIRNTPPRGLYYPGADKRLDGFKDHASKAEVISRPGAPDVIIAPFNGKDSYLENTEVFAPALSVYGIDSASPEDFLRKAVAYSNDHLHGTLGANILIHPATIKAMGKKTFESIVADLRYGCIAINAWTGLGFLMPQAVWGAFPGHTLDDVQSGIGFVHNAFLFDRPERTVVQAPFRPFPRTVLSGGMTLLPRPPWFVTNKREHILGKLLTIFQHHPSWFKIPRIFFHALLG